MYKILIIEDNTDIRENLEELLELCDYEVVTAENGAIGVEKFHTENPQLIICDVSMPVKNGYEVFAELRPSLATYKVPFIFLTASAQERDIAKGKVSGADVYMTKPYESDKLLEVISRFLKS